MQQKVKEKGEKGEKRKATKNLEEFIKAEYSDDELKYEAKKTKLDESIVIAVGTETEELPSTPLIEVPEEASNSLLKRTLTQEEIQEDRPLKRTNSVHLDSDGTEEPIKYSTRNFVNGDSSNIKNMKDGLKIAVFSQEASRNFSRKYHEKVKPGKSYQSHTGQDTSEMDTDISQKLTAKVKYQEGIEEHADAIPQLLENKESPHIIAVVEGKRETLAEEVIVEEGEHSYTYKLHEFYIEGENASGGKDAKQNMHFYIRDDMVHAVTPTVAVD